MIYTLPFIAALTGWVTNFLAIKMLFHPRKPVKILFFTLQGIFPKRQHALAEKIGKVVGEELFSFQDIKASLAKPDNLDGVYQLIEDRIDDFLRNKLTKEMPMLAMVMSDDLVATVKEILVKEFEEIIPKVIDEYADKLEQDLDVTKIVHDKIVDFSTDKLEAILFAIMKKEFKFIELVGAVLGFLIGVIQILLLKFGE